MKRVAAAALPLFLAAALPASAQLAAERVTRENAGSRLFSGSDANGGVGDWYLSNGVVEAIVDDAAFAPDLLARGIAVPIQSLLAPTGGTLIDVGLVGKGNDQLNQLFQVANLNPGASFFYTSVKPGVTASAASLTAEGVLVYESVSGPTKPTVLVADRLLGLARRPLHHDREHDPELERHGAAHLQRHRRDPPVRRNLCRSCRSRPRLQQSPSDADAEGIGARSGSTVVALPGNVGPPDGLMDTVTGASCGEVCYALAPVSLALDPDGPAGPIARSSSRSRR